jgi:hypothetical protein
MLQIGALPAEALRLRGSDANLSYTYNKRLEWSIPSGHLADALCSKAIGFARCRRRRHWSSSCSGRHYSCCITGGNDHGCGTFFCVVHAYHMLRLRMRYDTTGNGNEKESQPLHHGRGSFLLWRVARNVLLVTENGFRL